MSAPFCADPFTTVTAELSFKFASDFARLTSCVEPNESAAGRFSPDILELYFLCCERVDTVAKQCEGGCRESIYSCIYGNFSEVRSNTSALSKSRPAHHRRPLNFISTTLEQPRANTLLDRDCLRYQVRVVIRSICRNYVYHKSSPLGRGVSSDPPADTCEMR